MFKQVYLSLHIAYFYNIKQKQLSPNMQLVQDS